MDKKNVFLSYAWSDSDFANILDENLRKKGIKVKRDIRDIEYYGSIKDFMKITSQSDHFVLAIISKSFLRSRNCMYEATELVSDHNYKDRLLPIILNDAEIFTPEARITYVKYWEEMIIRLNDEIKTLQNLERINNLIDDLHNYRVIRNTIDTFMSGIADTYCVEFNKLEEMDFKPILDFIGSENINYDVESSESNLDRSEHEIENNTIIVKSVNQSINALKREKDSLKDKLGHVRNICNQIADEFSNRTGTRCSVNIKVVASEKNEVVASTIASDQRSGKLRKLLQDVKQPISDSTELSNALYSIDDPENEVFMSNKLPLLLSYKNPLAQKEYYGMPSNSIIRRLLQWPLPYKSVLVAPIKTPGQQYVSLLGFLTVDSPKMGTFSKNDAKLLSTFANSLSSTLLDLYELM